MSVIVIFKRKIALCDIPAFRPVMIKMVMIKKILTLWKLPLNARAKSVIMR